jgi:hypothetical protein
MENLFYQQGSNSHPEGMRHSSPVSGGRTIRLCSFWPSDDPPTPLRPSVDTGAGDRGGASAKFAVVLRYGGIEFEAQTNCPWTLISHLSVKSHSGIAPDPS